MMKCNGYIVVNMLIIILSFIIFLVFLTYVKVHFLISILMSCLFYIAISLIMSNKKKSPNSIRLNQGEDITLDEAKKTLIKLNSYKSNFEKRCEIRKRLDNICLDANKILQEVSSNPKSIRVVRSFFTYYLTTTQKIIKKYIELKESRADSKELRETLKKVENMLVKIDENFTMQITKLNERDIWDLQNELLLLEKQIEMEG